MSTEISMIHLDTFPNTFWLLKLLFSDLAAVWLTVAGVDTVRCRLAQSFQSLCLTRTAESDMPVSRRSRAPAKLQTVSFERD